jgi:hypothetical protein
MAFRPCRGRRSCRQSSLSNTRTSLETITLPCCVQRCFRFDSFSLVWRANLPYAASRHAVGQGLRHHQAVKRAGRILYRLDKDALPVLLQPGSLFAWRLPSYPEDLTFYRDAQIGLTSVSHEEMAWILDSEFAHRLPSRLGFVGKIVSESAYRNYWNPESDFG